MRRFTFARQRLYKIYSLVLSSSRQKGGDIHTCSTEESQMYQTTSRNHDNRLEEKWFWSAFNGNQHESKLNIFLIVYRICIPKYDSHTTQANNFNDSTATWKIVLSKKCTTGRNMIHSPNLMTPVQYNRTTVTDIFRNFRFRSYVICRRTKILTSFTIQSSHFTKRSLSWYFFHSCEKRKLSRGFTYIVLKSEWILQNINSEPLLQATWHCIESNLQQFKRVLCSGSY